MNSGEIWWVDLGRGRGREQQGFRPALVVSGNYFNELADTLALVVPCTTRSRGWINQVPIEGDSGLGRATYAMTEQVRVISKERLVRRIGHVDQQTMIRVRTWITRWLR